MLSAQQNNENEVNTATSSFHPTSLTFLLKRSNQTAYTLFRGFGLQYLFKFLAIKNSFRDHIVRDSIGV